MPAREQKRRSNWSQPEKQYRVVRKLETNEGDVIWLPVGHLSFWADGAGKLTLNMFPESYYVFPKDE